MITSRKINNNSDTYIYVDFSDSESINNIFLRMKKVDILIFFIGLAHEKGSNATRNDHFQTNYQILVDLLEAMKKNNCQPLKIIFASTISVYGERKDIDSYDENVIPMPRTPYALSKDMAEKYLLNNFSNTSWILRFAPVYSKYFKLNLERRTKIFDTYYKIGSGNCFLSLCNVKNINIVIDGIIKNLVEPGIYNISDKKNYVYNDLLKLQSAKNVLPVPRLFIWFVYYFGRLLNNNFLIENSIKLLTSNVYSSEKISKDIKLVYYLKDL